MKEPRNDQKRKGPRTWRQINKRKSGPRSQRNPKTKEPTMDVETMRAETLSPIVRRAHELSARGYYLYEVAQMLASEFGINAPSDASVSRWFFEAQAAYLNDIKGFRARETFAILGECQAILRKYGPIATADQLSITRFRKEDGETVPFTDENAFAEMAKATELVLKTHVIRAEVLGLKGGAALSAEEGKEQTVADLFRFMHEHAARLAAQRNGDFSEMPVLLMKSGLETEEETK